jgi:transcriptional regulator with XRE-family HTH domain
VINVALLGIIRRWHLRDQVPLREIARRLGISRNTVRRYLRSETTEPSYAERRSTSGLDKYSVQLSGWLKAETTKPRKQRRNLKQIHEDLRELGYEGSYDRVAAFARQWKAGQTEWVNSASKRTSLDTLAAEFGRLIEDIRSADLMDLFEAALEPLLNEPSFSNLNNQLETLLKADSKDAAFVFLEWSTGHKIALHVVASLVRNTKSQSLVLFDEPETHLHPPLMAALMQSVRIVLTDLNAFCVIATHSPVLLQETLAEHVRYVRRIGDTLHIENPKLETFGENVGVLTYSSFGLTASSTDYHQALDLLIKGCDSMDEVNEFFPLGLSGQATAYVLAKLYENSKAK